MENSKCKICRRIGEKLFLKGEKCVSQKCPLLRKPYPPGPPSKQRRRGRGRSRTSEYGAQLKETQKLKKIYGMNEKHFKKIIKEVFKKRGKEDVSEILLKRIERRLSNIVFRTGLAKSRNSAQQLISHGHFLFKGRKITIASLEVKVGDEIKLKEASKNNAYFKNIIPLLKTENIPSWISFDKEKSIIKVVREPKIEEIGIKVNISLVLAFYSK